MTEIRTARLLMRRARPDDLGALHAILSDRTAMRYWSSEPHDDLATTREWLASMIAAPSQESDDFVVEHDGRVIGKLGCWRLPDIGFIFHPGSWGRGFAIEALDAFIAYIFARGAPFLTADVDPRNAGSLALLGKAGFRETHRAERSWHIGGEWCDSVYLRLDRPAP
jgi:ribosomal-protein-alanine N-acetyltransferase